MRTDQPTGISSTAPHRIGLVFLAQRLEELTSPRSLDSHKAYTVNIPTLIEESVEQIEAIRDGGPGISPSSADCILEELQARISNNSIVSEIVTSSRRLLDKISKPDHIKNLQTLKMLKQEISGWAYATQAMHLIISKLDDKNKADISFLANELVSTLVNLGMSRRHINEAVVGYFWSKKEVLSNIEDLKSFFREIFPHHHEFKIYFKITSPVSTLEEEAFPSFRVKFSNNLPDPILNYCKGSDFSDNRGCHFVEVVEVRALDRYSAIDEAKKKVNLVQNLIRMFNHEINFQIKESVVVEQCCVNGVTTVYPELYYRRPVSDTTKPLATNRLKSMIASSRFLRGRHYEKFVSVCEFHGHSMDSSSIENKLLNLWISLETIAPSKVGNSKIENVVQGCLPSLGLGYVKRAISALSHDIGLWDRAKLRSFTQAVDEDVPQNMKLLLLIVQPKHKEELKAFLGEMGGQELLRNRIYNIHNSLNNSKSVTNYIESHTKKVSWQFRRIYRARNRIVHLGEVPRFVASLVDSAHDYFDQIITTVADISRGPNGFSDFDAAFSYLEWEYDAYRADVGKIDYDDWQSVAKLIWGRKRAIERYDVIEDVYHRSPISLARLDQLQNGKKALPNS